MKTALIMGISGGFGSHVAVQLLNDGWTLKAMTRHGKKLAPPFASIEVVSGDASDVSAIEHAAANVDLIVYGINPRYNQWQQKSLPMLDAMLAVAEKFQLQVVFPGNVYAFQPDRQREISENSSACPPTPMGEIRLAMEQRLYQASKKGVSVLIIRCGDFIGKNAPSTWLRRLIKKKGNCYQLSATGQADLPHSWAYLPDVAKTVSALLDSEKLGGFEVFHFSGIRASFNHIAQSIESRTGMPVKIVEFPWKILKLLAPFSSMIRAVLNMRYLWDEPLNLSNSRLKQVLGDSVPQTPLDEALINAGLING